MIKRIPLLLFLGLTWGQEYYTYNGILPEDIKREIFLSCQINSQGLIFFGDRLAFVNNIAIIVGNRFKENDKLIISVEVDDKVEYGFYAAVIKQLEIADAKRIPDDMVPEIKFIPYDSPPKLLTPIRPKYPDLTQETHVEITFDSFYSESYTLLGKVPEKININRKNILNCLINSSGNVLLGGEPIKTKDISKKIRRKIAENNKLIITVRANEKTKYSDYIAVIDQLKMANAKRIPNDVFPRVKFIPYDDPPRPLTPIKPKYPEIAQEAGIEGTVIVQVFVDKKGRVKETIILKGIPNTGLDEAAIAAIRETRFEPGKQRERPVGVWISIPVNFRLK